MVLYQCQKCDAPPTNNDSSPITILEDGKYINVCKKHYKDSDTIVDYTPHDREYYIVESFVPDQYKDITKSYHWKTIQGTYSMTRKDSIDRFNHSRHRTIARVTKNGTVVTVPVLYRLSHVEVHSTYEKIQYEHNKPSENTMA